MSTSSAIIRATEGGSYEGIYCHFDGYEEGVGQTLLDHYSDPEKVKRLIALGSISVLDERVEPIGPHSFAKREEGTTVAYHRDRGEDWESCRIAAGSSVSEVEKMIGHNGYVYVFENGKWTCNGVDLAEAIKAAGKEAV